MRATELYTAKEVEIIHEGENAILIEVHNEKIWIPISQITEIRRYPNGSASDIVMSAWIAKQKGLI